MIGLHYPKSYFNLIITLLLIDVVVSQKFRKRIDPLDTSVLLSSATNDEEHSVLDIDSSLFEVDDTDWMRDLVNSYPSTEECKLRPDIQNISCYLTNDKSKSCISYLSTLTETSDDQCNIDVSFGYTITNIGSYMDRIRNLKTSFDSQLPFTFIASSLSWSERLLSPSESVTVVEQKTLDLCKKAGSSLPVDIGITCANSSFKLYHAEIPLKPLPKLTCDSQLDLTCQSMDGGACLPPLQPSSRCDFRPTSFDFLFTGNSCASSSNSLTSDKFQCNEGVKNIESVNGAFVVVQAAKKSIAYFAGWVPKGKTFTASNGDKVEADMTVSIYDKRKGKLLQEFTFHSSCSQGLFLNDSFGAITIVGFSDADHQIVSRSSVSPKKYEFQFTVQNMNSFPIILKNISFDMDNDDNNETYIEYLGQQQVMPQKSYSSSTIIEARVSNEEMKASSILKYEVVSPFVTKECFSKEIFIAKHTSDPSKNSKSKKTGSSSKSSKTSGSGSKKSKQSKKSKRRVA